MKTRDLLAVTASIVCVLGATFAVAGPFPNPTSRPNAARAFVSIRCPAEVPVSGFMLLEQYQDTWVPRPWKVSGALGPKLIFSQAYLDHGSQTDQLRCRYGGPKGVDIYMYRAKGCTMNSAQNGFDC